MNSNPIFPSLPHMLFESFTVYEDRDAFRYRFGGRVIRVSYQEFGETVRHFAHGLAALDIEPGTHVGILSENRVEWIAADLALMVLGCVVVPVHPNLAPPQVAQILNDADVKILFVSNRYYFEQVMSIEKQVPSLKRIFSFDPIKAGPESPTIFERIIRLGEKHRASRPGFIDRCLKKLKPETVCSIVYTSGTTGTPKGARLHHRGFVLNVVRSEAAFRLSPEDVFLSYLPLSHLYERLAGHWCPLYRGATIFYGRSPETLVEDLRMARPTVLVGVPRMYESIMIRAATRMETGRLSSRLLLEWGLDIGNRHLQSGASVASEWVRFQHMLADHLVYRRFRKSLGGRLRHPISGGAPLTSDVRRFFRIMGLPIVEGYGMTETHLIVTLSPRKATPEGSCGKAVPGVELRIAPDKEILVRSDMLMEGYHGLPEETAKAIDKDGWLHTGDLGRLNDQGYLTLTGRKDDLLVLSGGELIPPAHLETKHRMSPWISDICLVGHGRPWLGALIVPDMDRVVNWCRKRNMPVDDTDLLYTDEALRRRIDRELKRAGRDLSAFEQIQDFILVPGPFTIAGGELTPTLKKRRHVLEKRFAGEISRLYASDPQ